MYMSLAVDLAKFPFRLFKKRCWKIREMAPNSYATHVPVLAACARLLRPARILEFGSGFFSTPLFLNKEVFGDAIEVCSIENDPAWFEQLSAVGDERLDRKLMPLPMHRIVETLDISRFDLIFVDDSSHARLRRKTLQSLRRMLGRQVVVIHDVDQWRIRLAMYSYPNCQVFYGLTPQTALAWSEASVNRKALTEVDAIIAANRRRIPEDDVSAWRELFAALPVLHDQRQLAA